MKKLLITTIIPLIMGTTFCAAEKKTEKEIKPLPEIAMGKPEASVTMVEYTSMTCPHCADFHLKVLPKIHTQYVNSGQLKVVHRDYPGDGLSLKATQLAYCGGPQLHQKMVSTFFKTQERWMFAKDPEAELKKIACENGLTKHQAESCLKDTELMDQIIKVRQEGQKTYNIKATPTLVVNGKIIPQALTFEEFQKLMDPLLVESKSKN